MDWTELYHRKKDLIAIESRLAELRYRATSISCRTDGMPHGGGNGRGLENIVAGIADIQAVYDKSLIAYYRCQKQFEQRIITIPDSALRLIGTMRCIELRTWGEIARVLGEDEWAVKQRWYRFVQKSTY